VSGLLERTAYAPAPIGPDGIRTDPFALVNRHGATLRGVVHRPPGRRGPGPVVILLPGLGMSRRHTVLPALYFLAAGVTVVRADLTNSVGWSDGEMADFTLSRACDDLDDLAVWSALRLAAAPLAVVAASATGRAAFRVAARAPRLVDFVGTVGAVVDVRASLSDIQGADLVGGWTAGAVGDGGHGMLFGHNVRLAGLRSLVEDNWCSLESTRADLARATGTRFLDVHGEHDPYVPVADVRAAFATAGDAAVHVLAGAGHELDLTATRAALDRLVRAHAVRCGRPAPPGPGPRSDELSALNRVERLIRAWWAETVRPPAGTVAR